MTEQKVRKRYSTPFTQQEKDVLKEVVGQFITIISNKKTDASSTREKKEAWKNVASTFNSYSNVSQRTTKQLHTAWKNMEYLRKRQASALSEHNLATGSGPCTPDLPEDPLAIGSVTAQPLSPVKAEFDTEAEALQSASSCGHTGRPASSLMTVQPLSPVKAEYDSEAEALWSTSSCRHTATSASSLTSFSNLTGTSVVMEGLNESDSQDHPCSLSSLEGEMCSPTTQIENGPTLSRPTSQSRSFTNFGADEGHPAQSSCTRDEYICRTSSAGRSLSHNARTTCNNSTEHVTKRSRPAPSATLVHSSGTDIAGGCPTANVGCGREQSHTMSSGGVVRSSRADNASRTPDVTTGCDSECSMLCSSGIVREASSASNVLGNVPTSNTATSRSSVLCEERRVQTSKLGALSVQYDELYVIRLREARATAEAAELRARAWAARARAEEARARTEEARARTEEARAHAEEARARAEEAQACAEEARAVSLQEQLEFNRMLRSQQKS